MHAQVSYLMLIMSRHNYNADDKTSCDKSVPCIKNCSTLFPIILFLLVMKLIIIMVMIDLHLMNRLRESNVSNAL